MLSRSGAEGWQLELFLDVLTLIFCLHRVCLHLNPLHFPGGKLTVYNLGCVVFSLTFASLECGPILSEDHVVTQKNAFPFAFARGSIKNDPRASRSAFSQRVATLYVQKSASHVKVS